MADRGGLKIVGFIFATVTLAVMLATGMVVKGHADGAYLDRRRCHRQPISHLPLTMAAESRIAFSSEVGTGSREENGQTWIRSAPGQRHHHHRQEQ